MSSAQAVQLVITFVGIAIAVTAFLWGPFGIFGNAALALVIFIAAGTAAGYAYARLTPKRKS